MTFRCITGSTVLLGVALALAGGCSPSPARIAWVVEFENASDRSATSIVHAAVHRDVGCAGAEEWSTDVAQGRQTTDAPGPLANGMWGLSAIALSGDCRVIASGCLALSVPSQGTVTVLLRSDPRACEGDECAGCGALDAGADAGDHGVDAGTTDAAGSDAAMSDVGTSDAGTSDAGAHDAAMPDAYVVDAYVVDAYVVDAGHDAAPTPIDAAAGVDACGSFERCADGIDNDCNGDVDCDDLFCAGRPICGGCPTPCP
jgi:hypothetical protein